MSRTTNELQDAVQEYIETYGLTTGQELLDNTGYDVELQRAYASYWDAIIIPDLMDKIERKIERHEQ